jgi:CheY-like chemotaxis protein
MLSCTEVLVASGAHALADDLTEALRDEGALVVCVEGVDAASEAIQSGFRPDAVVVDGALPGALDLVEWVRRAPELPRVPVVTASPAPLIDDFPRADFILVKRSVPELVWTIDRVCGA